MIETLHGGPESYSRSELCRALGVSRSGLYDHGVKAQRPRCLQDKELAKEIELLFSQSRCTYGARRLQQMLRRKAIRCGRNRLVRLMRGLGLRAVQKRRFRPKTTQSSHQEAVAPNRLNQLPEPPSVPNQVWCADLTYLPSQQDGWLYLAAELDHCSKRVAGWKLSSYVFLYASICDDRNPPRHDHALCSSELSGGQDTTVVVLRAVPPLNGIVVIEMTDPVPERACSVPPVVNLHDGCAIGCRFWIQAVVIVLDAISPRSCIERRSGPECCDCTNRNEISIEFIFVHVYLSCLSRLVLDRLSIGTQEIETESFSGPSFHPSNLHRFTSSGQTGAPCGIPSTAARRNELTIRRALARERKGKSS